MRQSWTYFVAGLFLVAAISAIFGLRRAQAEDTRVTKIEDPKMSGLKTDVPDKDKMETALKEREAELAKKENELKESSERLAAEEARLKLRIAELEKLQGEISESQGRNRERDDAILKRMVKTFETMTPKKASGVISIMNDELAVEVLTTMKEKKTAALLEVMDANRAMTLSSLMAKRRPAGQAVGEVQTQTPR